MTKETIFGYTLDEINKLVGDREVAVCKDKPINPNARGLEPCIEGSKKILADKEKTEMFRRIYRGK